MSKRSRKIVNYAGLDTSSDEELDASDEYQPHGKRRKAGPAPQKPKKTPKKKTKETHFPFLSLPSEIRNIIYKYTLVGSGKLGISCDPSYRARCHQE
ncbi:hypothetical protein N0V90_006620 [Kalmusia sp. IMI 367209]|nr:hypothetical protein N0V90_006620 [Kalmusia sp. IMI 367209]